MSTNDLRHELKMVCDAQQLAQVTAWVRLHPAGFRVAYPARQVNSLYFDTPNLNSFRANLAGVSERQKLRLRWYGPGWMANGTIINPTLELKYKTNMLGDKLRQPLDCVLDLKRPFPHLIQTLRNAAAPTWQAWLDTATQPVLINHYQRSYYTTPDNAVRLTVDHQLTAYDQRISNLPNLQSPIPNPNAVIIEIKTAPEQASTERLHEIMGHFPILRSRYSKYVNSILNSFI